MKSISLVLFAFRDKKLSAHHLESVAVASARFEQVSGVSSSIITVLYVYFMMWKLLDSGLGISWYVVSISYFLLNLSIKSY